MTLIAFASRIAALQGWRRYGLAVVLGAVLALALAPFFIWPLLPVCFIGLLLLTRDIEPGFSRAGRRYFFTLFAFAYGYFVAGLYWIGIAFLVDAERFAALIPLPTLGLPLVLAAFPALGAWLLPACLLHPWLGRFGIGAQQPARSLLLVIGFSLGEYLRGLLFTGFPWNLVAYAFADWPAMMQIAAGIGSHGMGLLMLLLCLPLALPLMQPQRYGWRLALLSPALFAVLLGAGHLRMQRAEIEMMPDIRLRIVQPSVEQTLKWRDDLRQQHLNKLAELTRQPPQGPAARAYTPQAYTPQAYTHVIWPETAIPYLLDELPDLLRALGTLLPPGGQLLTGAPRREFHDGQLVLFNSLFVVNQQGGLDGRYDKIHLVPFGEYLPFRSLLARIGLDKLAVGSVDFSPGKDVEPMILPGDLPLIRVLICYEAIFPSAINIGSDAPGMLLNITNDAWFGRSSGPYQHFAASRMRAVEQGVPLIRAANNGISAIVDPLGRVIASLGMDAVGVVDGPLPAPLMQRTTYSRSGDWLFVIFSLSVLIMIGAFRKFRVLFRR